MLVFQVLAVKHSKVSKIKAAPAASFRALQIKGFKKKIIIFMEFSIEGYPPPPSVENNYFFSNNFKKNLVCGLITLKHIVYDTSNSQIKLELEYYHWQPSLSHHDFAHYVRVCRGGRRINLVNFCYCFFSCFRPF